MLTRCKTPGAWIPLPTASHRLRPHARGVPLPRPTHPSGDLPASPTPRPAVGGAPAHCPVLRSKPEAGPQPLPGPHLAATGTSSHFPSCVFTLCLWGKGNPPAHSPLHAGRHLALLLWGFTRPRDYISALGNSTVEPACQVNKHQPHSRL